MNSNKYQCNVENSTLYSLDNVELYKQISIFTKDNEKCHLQNLLPENEEEFIKIKTESNYYVCHDGLKDLKHTCNHNHFQNISSTLCVATIEFEFSNNNYVHYLYECVPESCIEQNLDQVFKEKLEYCTYTDCSVSNISCSNIYVYTAYEVTIFVCLMLIMMCVYLYKEIKLYVKQKDEYDSLREDLLNNDNDHTDTILLTQSISAEEQLRNQQVE